ncbi:hypothetical protein DM01DRAFT_1362876 [Hesseltinella vesiculosa]|uniref:Xylanolytic transcriptional activator regulatory domain-containing protein n=1 Tax=Hesseltinella vesiculosa TaxID=101127 RepID=A0A1X2GIL1_9FUNG|nr:hypothetical protein DM01DRAFT_1362876 [Hesseltinella vesiculosa]
MYQTSDEPQTRPPNVMLLEYLGRLKPDEPIDNIDQWIAKVSGIDKLASDRLLKIYFAYIHPGLPVVNKQLFLKQYRGLADDYPSAPLLSAMYGAAARYIETCSRFGDDVITQEHWADPQKNWQLPPGGSERLFDNLLAYVRGHYHPGIDIIQALVIAQNHRATMEGKVTGGWLINSAAIRMAQDLGLHRSSESWDIPESEKETRRRVWWAVYIMDKWTSASTGRPQTVFDEDCDEKYPSESASWEEVMDVDEDDDAPGPRFPSLDKAVAQKAKNERIPLYQPFVQLVKLSGILGRVLQGLYTPRAKKYSAEHGSDAIVSFLDKSLSEWRSALPPTLQLSGASARKLDTKGKTPLLSMSGLMYLSYCTLLILLHRPFIEDKGEKKSSVSSLNICISAATRCVDIAERMHYRDFLLVSWNFAIYHVFTASLIHIYSVSKSEDSEAIATATEYLIKSVRLVRRLSKLSFAASQIHLVLMRLMKMRNVTIDDDDLMLDNESEGPTSANASHAAGKKAEHPSHQGSANPSPSNTNMPLPTTHGHDDHYGNTSASSTPTSLTNGDWINGLYSSMQSDGPPSQGQTASSSVELDPTSLQKFGMTMEQMFTPIEQIQQQQPPPPQPPMPLASPSSFNVMPLASQPSFLFSLWNSPSSHQYGNIPGYATPSSSLSSPSQANNTTISNNTNISNNSPSMPQTMPPSQPVNYMFPMMDQSSFRYHPDNPFWSVPSSLEMNDWAAYLFPSQQQVVQTPQSPSQKQSWTNNWM